MDVAEGEEGVLLVAGEDVRECRGDRAPPPPARRPRVRGPLPVDFRKGAAEPHVAAGRCQRRGKDDEDEHPSAQPLQHPSSSRFPTAHLPRTGPAGHAEAAGIPGSRASSPPPADGPVLHAGKMPALPGKRRSRLELRAQSGRGLPLISATTVRPTVRTCASYPGSRSAYRALQTHGTWGRPPEPSLRCGPARPPCGPHAAPVRPPLGPVSNRLRVSVSTRGLHEPSRPVRHLPRALPRPRREPGARDGARFRARRMARPARLRRGLDRGAPFRRLRDHRLPRDVHRRGGGAGPGASGSGPGWSPFPTITPS